MYASHWIKEGLGAKINTDIIAFHVEEEYVEAVVEILTQALKSQIFMEHGFEIMDDE